MTTHVVRPVPAVMAADVMRTMPTVVTPHAVMPAIAAIVVMTILHLSRQLLTALHGRCDARAVQRDCICLLRRRCDEQQSCDGSEAEKISSRSRVLS